MAERETKLLMEEYKQRKAPSMFFKDMLFNRERTFNQTSVQIDIVSATRRMADYNVRGNVANRVTKKGFLSYTYTPPIMNDSVTLSHKTCSSAVAGEDIYSPLSAIARKAVHMADAAMEMSEADDRRIEYQCYEALFNGEITVPAENGGSIGFPVDSDLLDIAVDNDWDTADATILDDIKDNALLMAKKGGMMPDMLVLGHEALSAFLSDSDVLAKLDNRNFDLGQVSSVQLPNDAMYHGTIDANGVKVRVYSYNGLYDNDGTPTYYMPAKKGLLINSGARREVVYAAVESNDAPAGMAAVPKFADTWEHKNPDGWIVRVQSAPLAIPVAIDSWATIQCISEA